MDFHDVPNGITTPFKNSRSETISEWHKSIQICLFVMQSLQIYVAQINANVAKCSSYIYLVQL